MKKTVFLLSILATVCTAEAQIVLTPNSDYCKAVNIFNPVFVRNNHISTITGTLSVKKPMKAIRQLGLEIRYEFDDAGRLINRYESYYRKGGHKDTLCIHYDYDELGRCMAQRKNDQYGFFLLEWKYDSAGNIIAETYSRLENAGSSKRHFSPGRIYRIREEKYIYSKPSPNQIKKTSFNSADRPYKEGISIFDEMGNLAERNERYIVTNKRWRTAYIYDKHNRLSVKTAYGSFEERDSTRHSFSYDTLGNIEEEKVLQNERPVLLLQFLYDKASMLLDARLEKDENSGNIGITRYRYEFR